jgi:hypothetical protein
MNEYFSQLHNVIKNTVEANIGNLNVNETRAIAFGMAVLGLVGMISSITALKKTLLPDNTKAKTQETKKPTYFEESFIDIACFGTNDEYISVNSQTIKSFLDERYDRKIDLKKNPRLYYGGFEDIFNKN